MKKKVDNVKEDKNASSYISLPPIVRQNLGISFAKVERRKISKTLRLPGYFEVPSHGRQQYYSFFPGRIEILVKQYQNIDEQQPLYRIHSERWNQMQQDLLESQATVYKSQIAVKIAEASIDEIKKSMQLLSHRLTIAKERENINKEHSESVQKTWQLWIERVDQLEKLDKAGGGRASELIAARAEKATALKNMAEVKEEHIEILSQKIQMENDIQMLLNSLPRVEAEKAVRIQEYEVARAKWEIALSYAADLHNMDIKSFTHIQDDSPLPYWQKAKYLEVRARKKGVVEKILVSTGSYLAETSLVVSTFLPQDIQFRASALQGDMPFLRDGLWAEAMPSISKHFPVERRLQGKIHLSPHANAEERTIDVLMDIPEAKDWTKPGICGYLEVNIETSDTEELCIPVAAMLQDQLQHVFFRRNPRNPDQVMRIAADTGIQNGIWIVIKSGITDGDEVVLDGIYELKLSTSGQSQQAGHFHADGAFHQGKH